jgi:hypothetical protein
LTPGLRFFSVAREKRRNEEAAMRGIERKSRFFVGVLLIGCISLTAMTLAAQQSGTVQGGAPASGAVPNLIKYSGVLKDVQEASALGVKTVMLQFSGQLEREDLCQFRKKRSCGESVIACCSAKMLLALS